MLLYMTLKLLLEKKQSTLSILNYPNLKKFQYCLRAIDKILVHFTWFNRVSPYFLNLSCLEDPIIIWCVAKLKFSKTKVFKLHVIDYLWYDSAVPFTAQKMKFYVKDFFSNSDQIRRKLQIWSHLLKISLTENFIFWAVFVNASKFPKIIWDDGGPIK